MKRRILFLFTLLFAAAASVQIVHAATIEVTSHSDSGPGSLRQALIDANDGDTILVARPPSGFRRFSVGLNSGELLVNKSVTISGQGGGAHVRGQFTQNRFRIFEITQGKTVTLSNLEISAGYTRGSGGGIYNGDGTLIINDCLIHTNVAEGFGGGIYSQVSFVGSPGKGLRIHNSQIILNSAERGGGIYSFDFASRPHEGTLHILNSSIIRNSAQYGGGLEFIGGDCSEGKHCQSTISNTTIDNNSAAVQGGGIYFRIFTPLLGESSFVLFSSTLSDNTAPGAGGIYFLSSGGLPNRFSHGLIWNTILKTGASGANIVAAPRHLLSIGHNLSNDDGAGILTNEGDQINTHPMLGPLYYNGGLTQTRALLPGSPAIDAGDPDPPWRWEYQQYDQRGAPFSRVVNHRIDIGSFEVQN